jgi:hypothetical protein
MRDRGGIIWAIIVVVVVALLVVFLSASDNSPGPSEPETFTQQIDALNHAYDQGKQASVSMRAKGLHISTGMCGEFFDATDASAGLPWQDPPFVAKARQYFINGCLGVPKPA